MNKKLLTAISLVYLLGVTGGAYAENMSSSAPGAAAPTQEVKHKMVRKHHKYTKKATHKSAAPATPATPATPAVPAAPAGK